MGIDFFSGREHVADVELVADKDKQFLSCSIFMEWHEILLRSVKCGASFSHSFSKRHGVSNRQFKEFNALIKGTVGVKGLAEISSGIESKTGYSLEIQESEETTEKYTFPSPECGKYLALIYQLAFVYEFHYFDTRFFHKDSWSKILVERKDRYHDASKTVLEIPECDCKPVIHTEPNGLLYVDGDRFSFLTEYFLIEDINAISVPAFKLKGTIPNVFKNGAALTINVSSEAIPPHILDLVDYKENEVSVKLYDWQEVWGSENEIESEQEGFEPDFWDIFSTQMKNQFEEIFLEQGPGEISSDN